MFTKHGQSVYRLILLRRPDCIYKERKDPVDRCGGKEETDGDYQGNSKARGCFAGDGFQNIK